MNISFSKNSFPQVKLFVAIPMFGGLCKSNCLQGMMDLSSACITYNIPMILHLVVNESLVQKARNACVAAFLESDFTHFLFIDADIGFTAQDALSMLYLVSSDKENKYDILAGPYPKKAISWKKVKYAINKGLADKDEQILENYTGNYSFLTLSEKPFPLTEPTEVAEIGTGFMMIPKRTFEKFIQAYPKNTYKISAGKKQFSFFDCVINPDTKHFTAQDHLFCQTIRKIGGRIWVAPWVTLTHQGTYSYKGSLVPSLI